MTGEVLFIATGFILAGLFFGGFRAGVFRRAVPVAVCVMVLVRDQERIIEGFLRELLSIVSAAPASELICVDEGSSDRTPMILDRMGRRFPIRVLERGFWDLLRDHPVTIVLRLTEGQEAGRLLAAVEAVMRGAGAPEGRESVARVSEDRCLWR